MRQNNPTEAEIQELPASLSISDEDLCSDCKNLAYCPGLLSVCKLVDAPKTWPCVFVNNEAYACHSFVKITVKDENWVPKGVDYDLD